MNPREASNATTPDESTVPGSEGSREEGRSRSLERARRIAVRRRIARDARQNAKGYTLAFEVSPES